MHMASGYDTNEVGRGAVLRYNIAVNLPYRTAAEIDVRIRSNESPIQVCLLHVLHHISRLVCDKLDCSL